MEAIPRLIVATVHAPQEHVAPENLVDQGCCIVAAGDERREVSLEAAQHRHMQHKVEQAGRQFVDDLLRQVGLQVAVVAGTHPGGHIAWAIAGGVTRAAGQPHAHRPAFGNLVHLPRHFGIGRHARARGQEGRRLVEVERQLGPVDFHEFLHGPQPPKPQRGHGARGDHQMQSGQDGVDQRLHQRQRGGVLHMMEVVDHQVDIGRRARQHFQQRGDQGLPAPLARLDGKARVPERAGQDAPERRQRPVLHRQREPGHARAGPVEPLAPLRHQRGLAKAGAAREQHQLAVAGGLQPADQPLARDRVARRARRHDLGQDARRRDHRGLRLPVALAQLVLEHLADAGQWQGVHKLGAARDLVPGNQRPAMALDRLERGFRA
ncbi:hypothetical protein D3C87_1186120 [compost metagenome]